MPRVLIVQAEMKDYRVSFFTDLYATLQRDGIQLTVAYSAKTASKPLGKTPRNSLGFWHQSERALVCELALCINPHGKKS